MLLPSNEDLKTFQKGVRSCSDSGYKLLKKRLGGGGRRKSPFRLPCLLHNVELILARPLNLSESFHVNEIVLRLLILNVSSGILQELFSFLRKLPQLFSTRLTGRIAAPRNYGIQLTKVFALNGQ